MTTGGYQDRGSISTDARAGRRLIGPTSHRAHVVTTAAADARDYRSDQGVLVQSRAELYASGCTRAELRARVAADRWQAIGQAVVLHNGALNRQERWWAAVLNCGPRAALTSFSALEMLGLRGWERVEIHVVAPAGVPRPANTGLPIALHRTAGPIDTTTKLRCHRLAPSAVIAAASFKSPRPAVGLLAALVQQRLAVTNQLRVAVLDASRTRHRAALLAALSDIEMGADALSEIDFVRLCKRYRLPAPVQQAIRVDSAGVRRYLDAEWKRRDGRRVAAEVDGAVHLAPRRWFHDQLRQNEITLTGTVVLRFPSVVVRTEPDLVAAQLRRALDVPRS